MNTCNPYSIVRPARALAFGLLLAAGPVASQEVVLRAATNLPETTSYPRRFAEWVQKHHDSGELRKRYPFDMADPFARTSALREGKFATARMYHADYTAFNRDRYAQYVERLRTFAELAGMRDVPYVINIHGSGGGRATTFPIGVSITGLPLPYFNSARIFSAEWFINTGMPFM